MRLFLDTADIDEIREINRWGVLSGITTNPTLVAKEGIAAENVWKEILNEVKGDVSLEVTETGADAMYEQGRESRPDGRERDREGPDDPRRSRGRQAFDRRWHDGST